jgi:hypothetical protein
MKAINGKVFIELEIKNMGEDNTYFNSEITKVCNMHKVSPTIAGRIIAKPDSIFTHMGIQKLEEYDVGDYIVFPLAMLELYNSPNRDLSIAAIAVQNILAKFESIEEVIAWTGNRDNILLTNKHKSKKRLDL